MAKKYIDADRLKAEIEGIRWFPQISSGYNDGREDMKMMVLDIIDSLQQEQPEVDLEKEIDDELDRNWRGYYIERRRFVESVKYFYNLGLNARKV